MRGLALEGGGAKGAFHMGVVKALIEEGYEFDGIVGTSIGAFNAAMIAQGDFDKCYSLWENMEPETLFNIENGYMKSILNKKVNKETISYLSYEAKKIIVNKGIDTSKLKKILDNYIDEDKLRKSNMDFGMVTISIFDLKPVQVFKEDIPYGKMKEYIMASANLPVFKIEPLDGKYYLDGGFYDNCPVNLLGNSYYDEIIAIKVGAMGRKRRICNSDINLIEVNASQDLGRALIFTNDLIKRNLKMGYLDAIKVIRNLKGSSYYIESVEEYKIFEAIYKIPDELIIEIGKEMNIFDIDTKRMLFEKIIPSISEGLKLNLKSSYQDIIIGILEVVAKERNVDRYRIYSLSEFIDEIKKAEQVKIVNDKMHFSIKDIKRKAIEIIKPIEMNVIGNKIVDNIDVSIFNKEM